MNLKDELDFKEKSPVSKIKVEIKKELDLSDLEQFCYKEWYHYQQTQSCEDEENFKGERISSFYEHEIDKEHLETLDLKIEHHDLEVVQDFESDLNQEAGKTRLCFSAEDKINLKFIEQSKFPLVLIPKLKNCHVEFGGIHREQHLDCIKSPLSAIKDIRNRKGLKCSSTSQKENCKMKYQNYSGLKEKLKLRTKKKNSSLVHGVPPTLKDQSISSKLPKLGKTKMKCKQCPYKTERKGKMREHARIHAAETPFKCTECDYEGKQRYYLNQHMRIHEVDMEQEPLPKIYSFKCEECSYTTYRKAVLIEHIRKHTGERPYRCEKCSFSATRKVDLKKHIRVHSGERPFQCDLCSYTAKRKSTLTKHIRTHTGEKPFKCTQCSYAASRKYIVTNHSLRFHPSVRK